MTLDCSNRNSNEDLLSNHEKEKGLFEKEKKRGDIEISELKRALHFKEKEIGFLNEKLRRWVLIVFLYRVYFMETYIYMFNQVLFCERSNKNVAILLNEVQLIKELKEQAVLNSEKRSIKKMSLCNQSIKMRFQTMIFLKEEMFRFRYINA